MNILILNWKDLKHPQVGGAEIIVYEISKRLVKKGHKVTWFSSLYNKSDHKDSYDGITVIRKGSKLTMFLYAPLYYYSLPTKPDIVVDMSNTILWQTPLWVRKSIRVAYVNQFAQDVFDYEFPKTIAVIGKVYEKFQYKTYKNTTFLCYSNSTKNDLLSVGIPPSQIHIFPMGLDTNRYSKGVKSMFPLFVCINRLVKMKRTELAIQAMVEVVRIYPKTKLYIVGFGYERNRLESIRNFLNLQKSVVFEDENILFFNSNKKDSKVELMKKAWALVFPSVKEGWGMTVTECAACGTPSIVTKVSGLVDSVKENKTGLFVSQNPKINELSNAMIRVIKDTRLRNVLSKSTYDCSKSLSWDKTADIFNTILLSLHEK